MRVALSENRPSPCCSTPPPMTPVPNRLPTIQTTAATVTHQRSRVSVAGGSARRGSWARSVSMGPTLVPAGRLSGRAAAQPMSVPTKICQASADFAVRLSTMYAVSPVR
ncbi:hypothetical protein [Ornithinimicrobium kibberense]|uniref:hypothetical protein n=1 Tax=Ornithinimicrobium kibberense TaxID=282060 RepID=UPI00361118AC